MPSRSAYVSAPALVMIAQCLTPGLAHAQLGSSNVASIEPPTIAHPPTTPCTVALYKNATFGGDTVNYSYQPPAACPGPWAKVVLAVDISLDAGNQYDRTGTIFFGGVNLWLGTTAEPRRALGPSWHVERDVTDDTALFETANTGNVLIANYFNSADTSTITSSASLVFYPANAANPAPRTPDMVIPLGTTSGTTSLNTGTDTLTRTLTLPPNIERAVFDTILQGQSQDEFWYTNVPTALSTQLEEYGGGAFREGELTIDGHNAGVAPVYPSIFTGGIDPLLWEPTPGVTTLDLKPYRVELTPFAGLLDKPGPHTLSLSVFGASNYFSVEGTLYLYLDHGAAADTGALLTDTLAAPAPTLVNTLTGTTDITGTLVTASTRNYKIAGTLATSHGLVTTTLDGAALFKNTQTFDVTPSVYVQNIVQDAETGAVVTTSSPAGTTVAASHFSYPLAVDVDETGTDTDTIVQTTKVAQGLLIGSAGTADVPTSLLAEGIVTQDTIPIIIDPATGGASLGVNSGAASAAFYGATGAGCTARLLASSANVLTYEQQASDCTTAAIAQAMEGTVAKAH